MKSLRFVPVLLVFLCAGVTNAIATNNVSVQVTNNTQYTMTEFYASDSDSPAWDTSNNLFAGQSLAPGQQTTINIGSAEDCTFDLMAVLNGANQYAYTYAINPCRGVAGRSAVNKPSTSPPKWKCR